jgi:hypothetical protein
MTLPEFPEDGPGVARAGTAPARQDPLRFDAQLAPRLLAAHGALNARFAELVGTIDREPAAAARAIEESQRQFSAIRHIETIWLHPVLERAVDADAGVRGQVMELRLIGLILARRVLRCFDDLQQAIRAEVFVTESAARATAALARYSKHSEHVVYPLYELVGMQRQEAA